MKNYSENSKIKRQPAETREMDEKPVTHSSFGNYAGANLKDKVAIITGGDSGIGQAVALLFAGYGIKSVIVHYNEPADAQFTVDQVGLEGSQAIALEGDVRDRFFCKKVVQEAIDTFGRIDILINNASVQYPQKDIADITEEQLMQTFAVNVFGMFYLTQEALKHMKKGGSIINTSSVTAFRGSEHLVDYAATKAAIIGFTRSLALQLAKKEIRVNAVAPGPVLTPLIPASFDGKNLASFGEDTLMGRKGQPYEIAPSYLFLVMEENSYMTGQVLHPNGGDVMV